MYKWLHCVNIFTSWNKCALLLLQFHPAVNKKKRATLISNEILNSVSFGQYLLKNEVFYYSFKLGHMYALKNIKTMHEIKRGRYLVCRGIFTLFDGWLLHRLYQLLYHRHGPFCPFSCSFSIWPFQPLQQPPLLWRVLFHFHLLQQNFLHRP